MQERFLKKQPSNWHSGILLHVITILVSFGLHHLNIPTGIGSTNTTISSCFSLGFMVVRDNYVYAVVCSHRAKNTTNSWTANLVFSIAYPSLHYCHKKIWANSLSRMKIFIYGLLGMFALNYFPTSPSVFGSKWADMLGIKSVQHSN